MSKVETSIKGFQVLTYNGYYSLYREGFGFRIVPLKAGTKVPDVLHVSEYFKREPSTEEYAKWFGKGKTPSIAAIMGVECHGGYLACIDIDNEEAKDDFLKGRDWPKTFISKTAKGYHLYFTTEKPVKSIKGLILPDGKPLGIELLGKGSLSTLPPSKHPSGIAHTVIRMSPLLHVPDLEEAFAGYITSKGIHVKKAITKAEITGIVPEGSRHETAKNYAKHLIRGLKLDSATALFELNRWNEKHCLPPLPEGELIDLVRYFSSKQRQISADLTEEFVQRRANFAK